MTSQPELLDAKPKSERFVLTLEIPPASIPAIQRLRAALKLLQRAFRMKCVEINKIGSSESD